MWFHDLRQAARRLLATPGFTLAALLSLALGIGANSALFTVVNGVALRPLPFADSERIVFLPRIGDREADVSVPDVADLRASSETLEHIGLFQPGWSLDLTGEGEPRRLAATLVDPAFLDVFEVEPLYGRGLSAEDNRVGADRVALLSYGFWQGVLGGDSGALGRTLVLSDRPTTVVGIMLHSWTFSETERTSGFRSPPSSHGPSSRAAPTTWSWWVASRPASLWRKPLLRSPR